MIVFVKHSKVGSTDPAAGWLYPEVFRRAYAPWPRHAKVRAEQAKVAAGHADSDVEQAEGGACKHDIVAEHAFPAAQLSRLDAENADIAGGNHEGGKRQLTSGDCKLKSGGCKPESG